LSERKMPFFDCDSESFLSRLETKHGKFSTHSRQEKGVVQVLKRSNECVGDSSSTFARVKSITAALRDRYASRARAFRRAFFVAWLAGCKASGVKNAVRGTSPHQTAVVSWGARVSDPRSARAYGRGRLTDVELVIVSVWRKRLLRFGLPITLGNGAKRRMSGGQLGFHCAEKRRCGFSYLPAR
jgi:hypothetical protein